MVRATPRVGTSMPAHVTAGGKALLAVLPDERLGELLSSGELHGLTAKSKTSVRGVRREIAQVRARGWAVNDGESEIGLRAVACAIGGSVSNSGVDAAITVAGPTERLSDERLTSIAQTMRGCIQRFAEEHGVITPPRAR
jgi:IclR family transcriptional regulator, acetate operon repressor